MPAPGGGVAQPHSAPSHVTAAVAQAWGRASAPRPPLLQPPPVPLAQQQALQQVPQRQWLYGPGQPLAWAPLGLPPIPGAGAAAGTVPLVLPPPAPSPPRPIGAPAQLLPSAGAATCALAQQLGLHPHHEQVDSVVRGIGELLLRAEAAAAAGVPLAGCLEFPLWTQWQESPEPAEQHAFFAAGKLENERTNMNGPTASRQPVPLGDGRSFVIAQPGSRCTCGVTRCAACSAAGHPRHRVYKYYLVYGNKTPGCHPKARLFKGGAKLWVPKKPLFMLWHVRPQNPQARRPSVAAAAAAAEAAAPAACVAAAAGAGSGCGAAAVAAASGGRLSAGSGGVAGAAPAAAFAAPGDGSQEPNPELRGRGHHISSSGAPGGGSGGMYAPKRRRTAEQ